MGCGGELGDVVMTQPVGIEALCPCGYPVWDATTRCPRHQGWVMVECHPSDGYKLLINGYVLITTERNPETGEAFRQVWGKRQVQK